MIGLVLLYFIGKYFYTLAEDYNKSKWLYAILGVVSYYGGTFAGGIILGIVFEFIPSIPIEEMNDYVLGFMALPFGIAICYGFYQLLKNNWKKKTAQSTSPNILDEDLV